jgi:hypothetical protein
MKKKRMVRTKKKVADVKFPGDVKALCWSIVYGIVIALLAIPSLENLSFPDAFAGAVVLTIVLGLVSAGIFTAFAFSDLENF